MSGIKRTPADAAFSDCVRERAGWSCEKCGREYPEGSSRFGLHCSHHFGRRHKSVRWEPMNAASLCFTCHNEVAENPLEHVTWFRRLLGERNYELLCELKERLVRKKDLDMKAMAKHYREELARMQALRAEGVRGRIEFTGWL